MITTLKKADPATLRALDEECQLRSTTEKFVLIPMGSQFDGLIKLNMDQLGVFCIIANPATITAEDIEKIEPKGIIISGGPMSAHNEPPPFDNNIFDLGIPILGICLGFQMWAKHVGHQVEPGETKEFGPCVTQILDWDHPLFKGFPPQIFALQSHGDQILPGDKVQILATTHDCKVAAGYAGHLYGTQFHPETSDTEHGSKIFENFCFRICKARDRFPAQDVARKKIEHFKKEIGDKQVLLALSGGSDSSVCAYLLKEIFKGTGRHFRGVYIKGIDRPDDEANVRKYFGDKDWVELIIIDAAEEFTQVLSMTQDAKHKRLLMRQVYKRILEEQAELMGENVMIAQGTLYTDISESGGGPETGARKAQIKLHHNFNLDFAFPELQLIADQVKDTARNIGRAIGVPEELLIRHPFPGPGMIVRIEGVFNNERLEATQHADKIWIEELRKENLYQTVWQAGVTLLNSTATYSKGDDAGFGFVFCLWAFWSVNGFTAQAAILPQEFIARVVQRIGNEVRGTARVLYNYTNKPPATIEWS